MDFLPGEKEIIFTERKGKIFRYHLETKKILEISGGPKVVARNQGGLLDIKISPKFKADQKVYIDTSFFKDMRQQMGISGEQNQTELQKNYPGITLRRLKQDYELAADKQKFLKDVLQGRPLEYIIENSFFYRSDFYVDSRVLIPRSESEILVESLINIELEFKEKQISVCEIGVGSFALGLSYLIDSKKEVSFTGTDISEAALSVAHINKEKHRNKISGHKIKL
ncbi:PQQ-dependent sugar dehydrogenase, partial [uncultured Pseudoalteromonas sp.]|uniref:PQQ-dependent sugar dehydrogenase n=1 Tax=uncultured Pseudoalteromonas sp. TaxID=114053 RepID=UPI002624D3B6